MLYEIWALWLIWRTNSCIMHISPSLCNGWNATKINKIKCYCVLVLSRLGLGWGGQISWATERPMKRRSTQSPSTRHWRPLTPLKMQHLSPFPMLVLNSQRPPSGKVSHQALQMDQQESLKSVSQNHQTLKVMTVFSIHQLQEGVHHLIMLDGNPLVLMGIVSTIHLNRCISPRIEEWSS